MVGVVAVIVSVKDLTSPSQDGWSVVYEVDRDDGERVTVQASCTGAAEAVVRASGGSEEALGALEDRCSMAAVRYAERAQSPCGARRAGDRELVV